MRIGIDCRLSGPQHAGIGRYIENLVARLPSLDSSITWVLFVTSPQQVASVANLANVEVIVTPVRHYSIAEQWQMLTAFNRAKLNVLHVPHFNVPIFYQRPLVVTIHDLLWHEYRGTNVTTLPASLYWLKYLAYRFVSTQSIKHATQILVPTQTIAQTLTQYYPDAAAKITITKEGIDERFLQAIQPNPQLMKKIPGHKKILIYLGSLYPHKNIAVVITALKKLPDYHLVICGARNVFQDTTKKLVTELGVENQVTFLGYVSDGEVAEIMRAATALVQPSLSEGFGLTGLEAMAVGTPVIASDIPVFKEIYQTAAEYFDPHSSESFVTATQRLNSEQRAKLIATGLTLTKTYSWDRMAEQTLEVLRAVAGNSP